MRIGVSYFMNAMPLSRGLAEREDVELVRATPARLSYMLSRGELDAALTSSVELLRGGHYMVSGYSISASCGGADAVLLSKVPLEQITGIALDAASITTNYMLQVLLHMLLPGNSISYEVRPGDALRSLAQMDACLLIGDNALLQYGSEYIRYDLTELWFRHTGLPMVFSLWMVRKGADSAVEDVILAACSSGCASRVEIAQAEAARLRIPEESAVHYLTECLDYGWSEAHEESLRLFGRLLNEMGLLKPVHAGEVA